MVLFIASKLIYTSKSYIKEIDGGNIVNKANIVDKPNTRIFSLGATLTFAKLR